MIKWAADPPAVIAGEHTQIDLEIFYELGCRVRRPRQGIEVQIAELQYPIPVEFGGQFVERQFEAGETNIERVAHASLVQTEELYSTAEVTNQL